jgi:hypothetical protein
VEGRQCVTAACYPLVSLGAIVTPPSTVSTWFRRGCARGPDVSWRIVSALSCRRCMSRRFLSQFGVVCVGVGGLAGGSGTDLVLFVLW